MARLGRAGYVLFGLYAFTPHLAANTLLHPQQGNHLSLYADMLQVASGFLLTAGVVVFAVLFTTRGSRRRDERGHRETKRLLAAERERFGLVLLANHDGIYDWNAITGSVYYSPRWKEILGYRDAELESSTDEWLTRIHTDDRERVERAIADYFEHRSTCYAVEYRMKHRDSSWRLIRARGQAIWDDQGRVVRFVGSHSDITERHQTEQALSESESRFDAFVNNSPALVAIKHSDGRYVYTNSAFARLCNRVPVDCLGRTDLELWSEDIAETLQENDRAVSQAADSVQQTEELRTADGTLVTLETSRFVYTSATGERRLGIISQDITQRSAAQLALREAEANYRELVEQSSEVIYETDSEGHLLFCNQTGKRLFGYDDQELIGRSSLDLVAPSVRKRVYRFYQIQFTRRKRQTYREVPVRTKDGRDLWIGQNVQLINRCGEVSGFRVVARDITERRHSEEELRKAKLAAEQGARAKAEFLASMSHEIRTPLNGVIGMTLLLERTPLSEEQTEYVNTIKLSGQALLTVIDEILDFSKLEAGRMHLESVEFDLSRVVFDALGVVTDAAQRNGLELQGSVADGVCGIVKGDPARLRQVLLNLIANAIKFTEHGQVVLRVTSEPRQPGMVRFEVTDTGIGIPAAQQDKIFESFSQADSSTTRRYGGTGLGLTICKRIVNGMGGQIGVQSQPGEGSTFWFTVPLPVVAQEGHSHERQDFKGSRILVVDDLSVNRQIARHYLEASRADVVEAVGGREALDILAGAFSKGEPFAAVVLDLHMPEMDGLQLARRIRAMAPGRDLPLIFWASHHDPDTLACTRALGVSAFLMKPLPECQFVDAVARAMGLTQLYSRPKLQPNITQTAQSARVLVAEDNATSQKVIRIILSKMGHSVDVVANGQEAVDALRKTRYDLIFMDCQMPEMDGFTAVRVIREMNLTIPVIALTAKALDGAREECLTAGFSDYLAKPVSLDGIQDKVGQWLDRAMQDENHGEENLAGSHSVADQLSERLRKLQEQGIQASDCRELAEAFVETTPPLLAQLVSAVESNDLATSAGLAHTLSGAFGAIGVNTASKLLSKLEADCRSGECENMSGALTAVQDQFDNAQTYLRSLG